MGRHVVQLSFNPKVALASFRDRHRRCLKPVSRHTRWAMGSPCLRHLSAALAGMIQRSIVLDLAGLQRDRCDVEAEILSHPCSFKFGRVEMPRNSFERMGQSSIGCASRCSSKALPRIRAKHPHKMPASMTDHRIKGRRLDLSNLCPVVANGFLRHTELIWEATSATQEYRMQHHGRELFFTDGTNVMPGFRAAAIRGTGASTSFLEEPVAQDSLVG